MKLNQIVVGFFLLFLSFTAAGECEEHAEGSSPWERCLAFQSLQSADKSLNEVYKNLRNTLSKPDYSSELKLLISSQRSWLHFRDQNCALVHALKDGMHDVHENLCKSEMTTERTKFLQGMLDEAL